LVVVSPTTTRQAEPDQASADAVDLARAVAEADAGPDQVGPHVGIEVEGDRVVTHLFASLNPAYVGWRWAVTVARAARSKVVTVSESMMLPGPDSLLAPPWVPWTERVRPGDLRAGDLMPASPDDERLVPAVAIAGESGLLDWDETDTWQLAGDVSAVRTGEPGQSGEGPDAGGAGEPGEAATEASQPAARPAPGSRTRSRRRSSSRGRDRTPGLVKPARVLSATGRDEAALRWYTSERGPDSPLASAAPANCVTCGFMVRLSGPLGRVFGVCANEYAPDDGKVVSVDHGCGAHSDGAAGASAVEAGTAAPKIDELGYDMLNTGATVPDSVLETLDHEQL
jgi:Protein of unknown function (DUF3027)